MPQIPAEFVPVLVQFPVVALVLGSAWGVLKWADRRHEAELAREKARSDAEIARVRQDQERALQDARAEVERVTRNSEAEIVRLRARITRLENMLDARLGRSPGEQT